MTCVKLKYLQQPVGKRSTTSNNGSDIIRPLKRIIYDARETIVLVLSEDVDSCVDEFLEEWAKVYKMVVISREGVLFVACLIVCSAEMLLYSCSNVKE